MEPALGSANADGAALESHPSSDDSCHGQPVVCEKVGSKYNRGWRKVILNFTPSWFAVTMGTGITSVLLHNYPYRARWLQDISYVLFALNVGLFVLFAALSLARYLIYPAVWPVMIRHPAQSLFIGCFPVSLATIINMIVFVCVPAWGGNTWKLAWALWWIDAAVAIATCFYLPFIIMAHHHHSNLQTMTATWLLPIVSTIVASATGGVVASILPKDEHALITLVASYILWGTGVPLAMCVLVIYFLRLTTQQFPAKEVIVSTFLPLGPLGQGGFSIMQLGRVARVIVPRLDVVPASSIAGEFLYTFGFLLGLLMWAFGLVWFFFALASISHTYRHSGGFPFNMGWWGFTFPLGVYGVCTTTLAQELPSAFFRVLGAIFSMAVVLLWVGVSVGTLKCVWTGEIFVAPCLKDQKQERDGNA